MSNQKPALLKGTRDFAPEVMLRRNYILDNIRATMQKFGFLPLETPALERLDVLTGKYGDEGDQLIFKILNSGDFLAKTSPEELRKGSKHVLPQLSKRALRYDLTVPFARFVAMNRGTLSFPFKRYQIQPVWRGDRPQKGRYQEFYQCDADVVGTDSLLCEAEIILMLNEAFRRLGLNEKFTIKINNRKILAGIAEVIGAKEHFSSLCVAIDKLDKIGEDKVLEELEGQQFSPESIQALRPFLNTNANFEAQFAQLREAFANSEEGQKGLAEIEEVLALVQQFTGLENPLTALHLEFDRTLARGLTYYTGAIFEVKAKGVKIGSISGGGRYDDLTGTFGLKDTSGVGISFGVDRIYDVLEALNLFPEMTGQTTQALFINFDEASQAYSLPWLYRLREAGIKAEIYPDASKVKKQMQYANDKNIPFVLLAGSDEIAAEEITIKNMQSGEQTRISISELLRQLAERLV